MKERKYKYRRNLPHIEKDDRPHFITFDTYDRWILPPAARDLVLKHCLHDNGSKTRLHVAVVMPDHVHMIFTPLRCETTELFTFHEILGGAKEHQRTASTRLSIEKGMSGKTNLSIMSPGVRRVFNKRFSMCVRTPSGQAW